VLDPHSRHGWTGSLRRGSGLSRIPRRRLVFCRSGLVRRDSYRRWGAGKSRGGGGHTPYRSGLCLCGRGLDIGRSLHECIAADEESGRLRCPSFVRCRCFRRIDDVLIQWWSHRETTPRPSAPLLREEGEFLNRSAMRPVVRTFAVTARFPLPCGTAFFFEAGVLTPFFERFCMKAFDWRANSSSAVASSPSNSFWPRRFFF